MRALTVWQPWATLLAEGIKKNETRSWSTSIRGPVAIHAARKPFKEIVKLISLKALTLITGLVYPHPPGRLPTGCVLAIGNLVDCKLIDEAFIETLSEEELLIGDYTIGRYAWVFEDMKHF